MRLPVVSANAEPSPVTVFLSYSWDTTTHIAWVKDLAHRLAKDGIPVTWDDTVSAGSDLALFMQQAQTAHRVLLICTPSYKHKADLRTGGVGYETRLLVARLINDQRNANIIPLLRSGSWQESSPMWLGSTRYLDLRGDPYSEHEYQRLIQSLTDHSSAPLPSIPVPRKPALRPAPVRVALLIALLITTYLAPVLAQDQIIFRPHAEWSQPNPMLTRYFAFTAVRFVASCLLLIGSFWLSRLEYRSGLSGKSVSIAAETTVGAAMLAAATCFFSMLNLGLLPDGGQNIASALVLTLPAILGYLYLCLSFLTLTYGIWKTASIERRSA